MAFEPNCAFPGLDAHNVTTPGAELGATYPVGDHTWMYVKAVAAIAATNAVIYKIAEVTVTDVSLVVNTGDRAKGEYPHLTDAGMTANAHEGSLLYLNNGTGAGQMKRIRSNTASVIYYEAMFPEMGEDDPFTTDPVDDDDGVIISPFHVIKVAASTLNQPMMGVAPNAIDSGSYGWIICAGPCLAGSGTTNNALVAGSPVCSGDDTAGQVSGAADGNDYYDIAPFATALHAAAEDQAAPIWVWPKR